MSLLRRILFNAKAGGNGQFLPGWLYRKSHVINSAADAGTLYQIRCKLMYGSYDISLLVSSPNAGYTEGIVYAVVGDYLYWGVNYGGSTTGYIYKTNLLTKATTTIYTGDHKAEWQGLKVGDYIYTVGEEISGGTYKCSLHRISTLDDSIVSVYHPNTRDCNEFIGVDTDGTYIVVGERVTGGVDGGSSWPNGGGLWRIPIATYNNTATWERKWEDPNKYGWNTVAYFNGKWYGILHNVGNTNARWRVVSSSDLVNWTTELDYTAQNVGQDAYSWLVKAGSKLVALGPVAATGTFHIFVFDGSSWTDYNLGIAIPANACRITGLWDANRGKLLVFVGNYLVASSHKVYEVNLLTGIATLVTSISPTSNEHVQSDQATYCKYGNDLFYGVYGPTQGKAFRVWTSDHDDVGLLNSHARTDFGDVRFTDDDMVTLLDYWLESKVDSDYAIFWVEVLDNLSAANATIYIYYGNPAATSISNGPNTFLFFDDFSSDTTGNYNKNAYRGMVGGQAPTVTYNAVNKWIELTFALGNKAGLCTRNGTSYGAGYAVDAKVRLSHQANLQVGSAIRGATSEDLIARASSYISLPAYDRYICITTGSGGAEVNHAGNWTYGYDWANWHVLSLKNYGNVVYMDIDYVNILSGAKTVQDGEAGVFAFLQTAGTHKAYVDEIKVRKFTYPEPAHGGWGA